MSETVSRAIARCAEQIDRQKENVENRFKSINNEIEHQILNASRELDESLNDISCSLANIFKDRKSVTSNNIVNT